MTAAGKLETAERRAHPRLPENKEAVIMLKDGCCIDCVIVNVSVGGALIELRQHQPLPNRFVLYVPEEDSERHCQLRRNQLGRVGVQFV